MFGRFRLFGKKFAEKRYCMSVFGIIGKWFHILALLNYQNNLNVPAGGMCHCCIWEAEVVLFFLISAVTFSVLH